MISKRQYASIVLIMAAVFLLFQGTLLGRERWGQNQVGSRASETGLRSDTVWNSRENPGAETARSERGLGSIVYLGDETASEASYAAQWARYAKRELSFAASAADPACETAELVLVPGERLPEEVSGLRKLTERGVNVLCLSLPAAEEIEADSTLRELLGIRSVFRTSVQLKGLHIFSGFFLGGERIYTSKNDTEEAERQDLPLDTPWYIVRNGTEIFMQGILDAADTASAVAFGLKNEDYPAILWRHHSGSAELFAVNGPYMADREIAGGVIQAVLSQLETTSLYPVVDAQLFSLVDFPALSDDNSAELLRLYGREATDITRNIILPSLVSLPSRYDYVFTAFAAPQLDYGGEDGTQPGLAAQLEKTLIELRCELGLSLRSGDGTPLDRRLEADSAALAEQQVTVSAAWAAPEDLAELRDSDASCLSELRTVMTAPDSDAPPLDYFSENVTLQRMTSDAMRHTFMQDLRLLCRETSLGYDSSYCDFSSVWRPQTETDLWQNRAELVLSNLVTYRAPFETFARVTASECDARLRRFLMADYGYSRRGEEIMIQITPPLTESSFVLRLNGETIAEMQGGSWVKIEEGAFLLRATDSEVRLRIAPTDPLSAQLN